MENLEFMGKFKPEIRCIKEFEYWIVCIRGKQVTLGDAVILLKRQTSSVANIFPEESIEFPKVINGMKRYAQKNLVRKNLII